jgi:ribonuclease BN (tRNA processing enzyme)
MNCFNPGPVCGILMTHYHSDHIDIGDLAEVATGSWMQNAPKRDGPLPIYGGPGIEC